MIRSEAIDCLLDRLYPLLGTEDEHIRGAQGEDAGGDDASDVVDLLLQSHRFHDAQVVHIEDDVAVVGDEILPPHRGAAQLDQFPRHMAAGHGDHFDRQGKLAQYVDQLAAVGDADEGATGGGDDLLPGQGATAALDQLQVAVGLVGAIDIEVEFAGGVEIENRDAVTLEALGGGLGAGDGAGDLVSDGGKQADEMVDGGSRS